MFGLDPSDVEEGVELWACNIESFSLFEAMGTQWRTGMNGATGLDYQSLPVVMGMLELDVEDKSALFADVRVMERAALGVMAEARDDR